MFCQSQFRKARTFALALLLSLPIRLVAASVEFAIFEHGGEVPLPCRIHLSGATGQPVKLPHLTFWKDHFVCDGRVSLELAPGDYHYAVERGPEYSTATGTLAVAHAPLQVTNRLRRLANLASEGWWSGETHIHRPLRDIELLMRAEDLHVAEVTTWWNDANPWTRQALPSQPVVRFDENRFYDVLAGEDERGGGALLYFGLERPLPIAGSRREYPSTVKFLRQAKQEGDAWVEIEKPFWWDTPIWLASRLVGSVGLAHNHLHRSGVLDSEAWGRPRNRASYPGPHGNGRWTQDIYAHILNCGLRLPPSAGSASGVLPNPVGYNRAYVQVEGALTYEKWWQGLRAGRVFVSNGPLLRVRANGQWPGHVFRSNGPVQILLEGQLDSRDPVRAVELVRNGRVDILTLPQLLTVSESGWFLVRAVADVTNTLRFASTGPWYVEIGSAPRPVRRESARFFLDWVRERMDRLQLENPTQRDEVLEPMRQAEAFWKNKLAQAVDLPEEPPLSDMRRPTDEAELRYWLENMVRFHRFTPSEVVAATGLSLDDANEAVARFDWRNAQPLRRRPTEPLRVLPYPGGRHPRIGFLDGAILPQRETKISVFTPWDEASYVVVDVPEAIWSNLGLIYLAHTHIPTVWDQQGVKLPRLEWNRHADGTLAFERSLPNGVVFGARVVPTPAAVRMELWLRNGSSETLSGLRVQNCVMLRNATGFAAETPTNKVFAKPYAAVRSAGGDRWIITAWDQCDRTWGNERVPCLHADPQFPDCPPGETVRLRGWLSFFEGVDVESEFERVERTGWRRPAE